MALNPALAKIVSAAKAKHEAKDEQARELLLNMIGNTLERIHATPSGELVDYPQEAIDLLETVEQWCVGRHEDGYLIFRDTRDEVTREAI